MNKDHSHSWVRISHNLNKLVTDLSNSKEDDDNEQETSEMQFEDFALKTNVLAFAGRAKVKGKPQRRISASSSTKAIPIGERTWTDIEPQDYSPTDHSVSKKLIHLLRHGSLPRESDGAIEFWRIKDNLQKHFLYSQHLSDEKWKSIMAKGGGNKKRFQYCTDPSILYLRALQGHSGRNLIDPSLQDNVLIPDGFFKYIYHVGCAINLTFHRQFRIDTGRSKFKQGKTVFFTAVNPMDKDHKDLETIDLSTASCMVQAENVEETSKHFVLGRHQTCSKERIKVLSNVIECHHLLNTLPAYCIPKAIKMETGEIISEKRYESPRPLLKISLRNNWTKELGPDVAR